MKKGTATVLSLLLASAVGGGVFYQFVYKPGMEENGGRVSSTSEDAVYVDSVKMLAGLGSGSGTIQRYAGVIEPQQTWEAKIEGEKTVKTTYVKEGDEVKVGDKLFTYDTSTDEDTLEQDKIELERNKNELVSYQTSLETAEKLLEKAKTEDEKLTQSTNVLTAQTNVKSTEYEITKLELEITSLEKSLNNADVLCELEGVVQSVGKANSSSSYGMDSGSEAYITVMAVGEYRVKGTVNEQNRAYLYPGQDMLVYSRVDDQSWSGTLTEVKTDAGQTNQSDSYYYDSSSGDGGTNSTNYPFYVELDNSEGLILGQHVYMEPDEGQGAKREGIWLPAYYFVTEDDSSMWVWAASSKNTLEKRAVTTSDYDEALDQYQIGSGLDGEDYITTPIDGLEEGLPVIYMDNSSNVSMESVYGYGQDAFDGSYEEDVWWDDGSWDDEWDDGSWDDAWYWDDGSLSEDEWSEDWEDESEEEIVLEEDEPSGEDQIAQLRDAALSQGN